MRGQGWRSAGLGCHGRCSTQPFSYGSRGSGGVGWARGQRDRSDSGWWPDRWCGFGWATRGGGDCRKKCRFHLLVCYLCVERVPDEGASSVRDFARHCRYSMAQNVPRYSRGWRNLFLVNTHTTTTATIETRTRITRTQ